MGEDILKSETHQQGGRKIIVREITPIQLPPTPAETPPGNLNSPELQEHIAQLRERQTAVDFLSLGATVYRTKNSPPRTLVNLHRQGQGGSITFWSTADFALLSGFASFMGSDGIERRLMMTWSNVDIDRLRNMMESRGRQYIPSPIPEFPAGKATFSITGGSPDAATLASIQSLHDLYNNDYERLKAAYDGRERSRIANEAELKAHPPKPKDIVLNYWRMPDAPPATDYSAKGGDQ